MARLDNIQGQGGLICHRRRLAATFLKAEAYEVGGSLVEEEMLVTASRLIKDTAKAGAKLVLPVDVLVADEVCADAKTVEVVPVKKVGKSMKIVDVGPETLKLFKDCLGKCIDVSGTGRLGIYEIPRFAEGTKVLAEFLAGWTPPPLSEAVPRQKLSMIWSGG